MKLWQLLSFCESSVIYVYSNPCENNSFDSKLLCTIECYESHSCADYYPDKATYSSFADYNVVAFIDGKLGICVYVEVPDHV